MKKYLFYFVAVITTVLMTSQVVLADAVPAPSAIVPTLGEWGMIGTALVLGFAGAYRILKNKK